MPFIEGTVTEVEISAYGFESQKISVTHLGQKIEVELANKPDNPAILKLRTPSFPQRLAGHENDFRLKTGFSGSSNYSPYQPESYEFTEHRIWRDGTVNVTLVGGENWGYPWGVLAGPVEVTMEYGEVTEAELPFILDPPFPVPVSVFRTIVLVGGETADVLIPVTFENREDVLTLVFEDGGIQEPRHGFIKAATDGEQEFPIKLEFAREAMMESKLKIELPHTIEIHVQRNGNPVEDFKAEVSGEINSLDNSIAVRRQWTA